MVSRIDLNGASAALRIPTARTVRDLSGRKQASWQHAQLIEIIKETLDAVTLRLRLVESADFLPGQYDNVRLSIRYRARNHNVSSARAIRAGYV